MQTGRFLVSPETESRCWPERRSKMTKGGTLFIEQNCASLQQTLLFVQNSGTAGICWSWGAIQIPLLLRFLSEEVTPPTSHCYKQGGTPQSQYPTHSQPQGRYMTCTRPSWFISADWCEDRKMLGEQWFQQWPWLAGQVTELPTYWYWATSYPFPNSCAFWELLASPPILLL